MKKTGARVTGTRVTGTRVTGTRVTGTRVTGTRVTGAPFPSKRIRTFIIGVVMACGLVVGLVVPLTMHPDSSPSSPSSPSPPSPPSPFAASQYSCLFVPDQCHTLSVADGVFPECAWMYYVPPHAKSTPPTLERRCSTLQGPVAMNNTDYMNLRLHATAMQCSSSIDSATCKNITVQDDRGLDRAIASLKKGMPPGVTHQVFNMSFGVEHDVLIGENLYITQENNRTTDVYIPSNPNGKVLVYLQFKSSDGFMEDWGFDQTQSRVPAGIFDAGTFAKFASLPPDDPSDPVSGESWMSQYGFWELNAALFRLLEENYTLITTSEFATYDNINDYSMGDTYYFRDCVDGLACGCVNFNKWWNNGSNPDVSYMTWLFDSIANGTLGIPAMSIEKTSIMGYSVGALAVSRYIEENAKGTPGFPQFASVILLSAGSYKCYQFNSDFCPWGTEAAYDHNLVQNGSHPPTLMLGTSNDFDADPRWFDKYFNTSRHFSSPSIVIETNQTMHGMDVVYIEPIVAFLREYGSGGSAAPAPPTPPGDAATCTNSEGCCFYLNGTDFDASCAVAESAYVRAPYEFVECNTKAYSGSAPFYDNAVKWCGPSCITTCEYVAQEVNNKIYDDERTNGVSIHVLDGDVSLFSVDDANDTCPQEGAVSYPPWCPGKADIARGAVSFSYLDIYLESWMRNFSNNLWIFDAKKTRGYLFPAHQASSSFGPRSWKPTCYFLGNAGTYSRTDCGCGVHRSHQVENCTYKNHYSVVETGPTCNASWSEENYGIPFDFKNRWAYDSGTSCSLSETQFFELAPFWLSYSELSQASKAGQPPPPPVGFDWNEILIAPWNGTEVKYIPILAFFNLNASDTEFSGWVDVYNNLTGKDLPILYLANEDIGTRFTCNAKAPTLITPSESRTDADEDSQESLDDESSSDIILNCTVNCTSCFNATSGAVAEAAKGGLAYIQPEGSIRCNTYLIMPPIVSEKVIIASTSYYPFYKYANFTNRASSTSIQVSSRNVGTEICQNDCACGSCQTSVTGNCTLYSNDNVSVPDHFCDHYENGTLLINATCEAGNYTQFGFSMPGTPDRTSVLITPYNNTTPRPLLLYFALYSADMTRSEVYNWPGPPGIHNMTCKNEVTHTIVPCAPVAVNINTYLWNSVQDGYSVLMVSPRGAYFNLTFPSDKNPDVMYVKQLLDYAQTHFAEDIDLNRPIVLSGWSTGGHFVSRLLEEEDISVAAGVIIGAGTHLCYNTEIMPQCGEAPMHHDGNRYYYPYNCCPAFTTEMRYDKSSEPHPPMYLSQSSQDYNADPSAAILYYTQLQLRSDIAFITTRNDSAFGSGHGMHECELSPLLQFQRTYGKN